MMLSADGLTWAPDSASTPSPELTISFVPDGTDVAGQPSSLFAEFQALQTVRWQQTIIEGFETWTQYVDTNVASVLDIGSPLGVPGPAVGDDRFGDVRVAAVPLGPDVIAMSVPLDEVSSGTWAGDVLVNANFDFANVDELFAVIVHEAGHVLGLGHSSDPLSPMHLHGISDAITPLAEDIAHLRRAFSFGLTRGAENGLDDERGEGEFSEEHEHRDEHEEHHEEDSHHENEYGAEEEHEGSVDGSFSVGQQDSAAVQVLSAASGRPLLYEATGSIESGQDVDVYRLAPTEMSGEALENLTVTVRTAESGGLIPQVAVFSTDGELLPSEVLANTNGTLVLQVRDVTPEESYLVRVTAEGAVGTSPWGAYQLEAQYVHRSVVLDELFAETLRDDKQLAESTFRVTETTLAQFVLAVDPVDSGGMVAMWTSIYDSAGSLVNRIAAPAGKTRSSGTLLLFPGDYRIEFQADRPDGQPLSEVPFRLLGKPISLQIGPIISDPTPTPLIPIIDNTTQPGDWSPPDLVVTDPIILPSPDVISMPAPSIVVDPPWFDPGWWYWDQPALVGWQR